jgi:hypothetical protein
MRKALKVIHDYWMRFARLLGRVQTTVILFVIYFGVVGVMAVISFVFGRDFLDKRLTDRASFWRDREGKTPALEESKRQF